MHIVQNKFDDTEKRMSLRYADANFCLSWCILTNIVHQNKPRLQNKRTFVAYLSHRCFSLAFILSLMPTLLHFISFRRSLFAVGLLGSLIFGAVVALSGCNNGNTANTTIADALFADPAYQRICNAVDKRDVPSIIKHFRDAEPANRLTAVSGFATIQDTTAIDSLAWVLRNEKIPAIREAAAFGLGVTAHLRAADTLAAAFKREKTTRVRAAIIEAAGRAGNSTHLNFIATTKTYPTADTALWIAKSRSMMRFLFRNITTEAGTRSMYEVIRNRSLHPKARITAAYYLNRAKNAPIGNFEDSLCILTKTERDAQVRMYLVGALGRGTEKRVMPTLDTVAQRESDWRVKVMLLRSVSKFGYKAAKPFLEKGLTEGNVMVAQTAAEQIRAIGTAADAEFYAERAKAENRWQVAMPLFATVMLYNRRTAATELSSLLTERYNKSSNIHEKGAILSVLAESGQNFKFIRREASAAAASAFIKTAGSEAIVKMRRKGNYFEGFKWKKEATMAMDSALHEGILSGDAGMVATYAEMLRDSTLGFRTKLANPDDRAFLQEGLGKLKLPRDLESYNGLQEVIAFLEGKKYVLKAPRYNNPIDFALLASLPPHPKAIIQTARGEITIELYPRQAPGSVANFVKLAKAGFFNGKTFHRIVPNFVVQGGCPRGDGFGNTDFTIRTEISPSFFYDDAGWVGMASAGKDTEATQWFITHSATPHLDGRYTIFGKVIRGLDVVDKFEIGDKMVDVKIR